MVVVTAAFGSLSGKFGYPACFIGLGLIYNLDKKTLDEMNADLAERHAENA